MVCRHGPNDPNCSANRPPAPPSPPTPNPKDYEVLEAIVEGKHLIMKVQYPSCRRCSYEGIKTLVFRDVPILDALRWRVIDPHFRDPADKVPASHAPSPVARFPGSPSGWEDALRFARTFS